MKRVLKILLTIASISVLFLIGFLILGIFAVQDKYEPEQIENRTHSLIVESKAKITRPCDFRTLKDIDSLLRMHKELENQTYLKFIVNMRIDCSENVEYSEWNNELIFKMLEKNPKMFVAFLSRFSIKAMSNEKTDFVLNELRNPIYDGIELNAIYEQLDKTETEDEEIKAEILKSLKIAEQKKE